MYIRRLLTDQFCVTKDCLNKLHECLTKIIHYGLAYLWLISNTDIRSKNSTKCVWMAVISRGPVDPFPCKALQQAILSLHKSRCSNAIVELGIHVVASAIVITIHWFHCLIALVKGLEVSIIRGVVLVKH